ncbi:DUF2513 domain-containing protein [Brucella intermedia]|uniref:DUF2513 domain-containing protein n=1 Tax=Brucella TaxID=234 RepID=UPI0009461E16|nr:DUF2513 domain-containing protein [Brucella intermedia]
MKLEMDLIRELLLYIEEHATDAVSSLGDFTFGNWSHQQIAYHVVRAREAGFIVAIIDTLPDEENPDRLHACYTVQSLTFQGHEFLSSVREPKHWEVVKSGAKKAGIASVGVLASFAEEYAKGQASRSWTGSVIESLPAFRRPSFISARQFLTFGFEAH